MTTPQAQPSRFGWLVTNFAERVPGVAHAIVGAGDRPSLVLAVGARTGAEGLVYPVDAAAAKYGASPRAETTEPNDAYEGIAFERGPYKEGWLPD